MRKNLKHTIKGVLNEIKENLYFIPENDENQVLDTLKSDVEDKVKKAYEKVTGKELNLPKFKIKVDNKIKDGKIAGMVHPDDDGNGGFIGVKSKALKDREYLKWVITHELIHASVGEDLDMEENHSGLFNKIADEVGLPKKYRD
jgi:hypothetical protein